MLQETDTNQLFTESEQRSRQKRKEYAKKYYLKNRERLLEAERNKRKINHLARNDLQNSQTDIHGKIQSEQVAIEILMDDESQQHPVVLCATAIPQKRLECKQCNRDYASHNTLREHYKTLAHKKAEQQLSNDTVQKNNNTPVTNATEESIRLLQEELDKQLEVMKKQQEVMQNMMDEIKNMNEELKNMNEELKKRDDEIRRRDEENRKKDATIAYMCEKLRNLEL